MKVVILAGGLGTRLKEETGTRPKPMVEIGSRPMIWHIMKIYGHYGFNDFLIAAGYKGEIIKEYFLNYYSHERDATIDLKTGKATFGEGDSEDWTVSVIDTGITTQTGGRIRRLRGHLDGTFMATYGDGAADIDVEALVSFHRTQGRLATLTAVRPPARFGALVLADGKVERFVEKPQVGEGWINGGFFVFEPGVLDYIEGDDVHLEREPLERLAAEGQLSAFKHEGFWQPMDTLRDADSLIQAWESGLAPWRVWKD